MTSFAVTFASRKRGVFTFTVDADDRFGAFQHGVTAMQKQLGEGRWMTPMAVEPVGFPDTFGDLQLTDEANLTALVFEDAPAS